MKLRDWMDQQHQDVSEIKKDISEIKVDNAETKANVRQHIKRTDLLDESVEYLRQEFSPVKTHVAVMGAFGKILLTVCVVAGTVATVYKVFFM